MMSESDSERYRMNMRAEQESALLYEELSKAERDPHLAELYRRMSGTEQRHADMWAGRLRTAGQPGPVYTPGWRIRTLIWLARRFGSGSVLPMISMMEREVGRDYENQPEAHAGGMLADEHSHARLFRAVQSSTGGGIAGPLLAQFEGRHRSTGGNALRAAVLGASDGLTTNLSLVMGVAGPICRVIRFIHDFGETLLTWFHLPGRR